MLERKELQLHEQKILFSEYKSEAEPEPELEAEAKPEVEPEPVAEPEKLNSASQETCNLWCHMRSSSLFCAAMLEQFKPQFSNLYLESVSPSVCVCRWIRTTDHD